MKIEKSEIQSGIATAVICVLILLILFFFGMTVHRNEVDEGVMVSFGYDEEGFGETVEPVATPETAPAVTPQPVTPPTENDLLTQEDPSVALEAEKLRKEEQQRREYERQEKERREREAREAAIKAEQDAKRAQAGSLLGGAFSNKGSGSGNTVGDGKKGNPAGRGSQNGNTWELGGRDLKGVLSQPSYKGNEQGKIVVKIRVDAQGNVISADIDTGTTITDERLREETKKAAMRNKFSSATGVAIGKITYNFVLN